MSSEEIEEVAAIEQFVEEELEKGEEFEDYYRTLHVSDEVIETVMARHYETA